MLNGEIGLIETVESFGEFGVFKGDLLNGRLESEELGFCGWRGGKLSE
jgi:hypothetical protein